MKRSRSEFIICLLLLLAIFGLSLFLRISLPWSDVFGSGVVKLTDNDAYYYVRLLDNLCAHFPLLGNFDPYFAFPDGTSLSGRPLFFVYFMGFLVRMMGGGAPVQQVVDAVAVYLPAVLGALMVFPVFIIGRLLINKWAGLAAAFIITLLPGEYLARTLLGNADTHVLEIFLTTLFMMFIMLAAAGGSRLKMPLWQQENRKDTMAVTIYMLLGGICLGMYIATWIGALLFIGVSFVWLIVQFLSDHFRKRQTVYLGMLGALVYGSAVVIAVFAGSGALSVVLLFVCMAASIILAAISFYFQKRDINPRIFVYIIIAVALIALVAVMPSLSPIIGMITPHYEIAETQPLLIQNGQFTLLLLWGNYTAASLLALAGLVYILYRGLKYGGSGMLMMAVWSLAMLVSALIMRRFSYYLAVCVAILAGVCCWLILRYCGFREEGLSDNGSLAKPTRVNKKKKPRERDVKLTGKTNPALMAVGVLVVLVLIVYPNTGPLPGGERPFVDVATKALFAPSDGWYGALKWLRENSPEPFGDDGYYYEIYRGQPKRAAYSVLTWWDYGYWVIRIGHRVPVCNPGYSLRGEEKFFIEQDAAKADDMLSKWKTGYLLVDDYMINWQNGFRAIAFAAGSDFSKYCEIYYRQQGEGMVQTLLYHPAYYETMAVRLFCFDGKKYMPSETAVISWEPMTGNSGGFYKLITNLKTFRTYTDAASFIASQKSGNWQIVGKDPHVSPVPLEALDGYKLVYSSGQTGSGSAVDRKMVKVFEYTALTGQHE